MSVLGTTLEPSTESFPENALPPMEVTASPLTSDGIVSEPLSDGIPPTTMASPSISAYSMTEPSDDTSKNPISESSLVDTPSGRPP